VRGWSRALREERRIKRLTRSEKLRLVAGAGPQRSAARSGSVARA
jgi:predicted GIY-YIG superfamily endonuclease